MTIKKITKWEFPVGNQTLSQNAYYRKLSLADSGFFPIGQNKLWHGGIHIDEKVISELQVDHVNHFPEVKCMADGEIIAYRLNETYPSIEYDDETALYSSSFILIRHLLQMDYVTPSMSIDDEFEVIAGDDMMSQGVNVRVYPQKDKIGMLSNGAEITVALDKEQVVGTYYWYPLMSINNGYSSVPKLETIAAKTSSNGTETLNCLGWISLGKTKLITATQTITGHTDKPEKNEALQKGLAIRATKQSNGNALSLLPIGSKLKLSEFDDEQKWGKVATLSAGSYSSTANIVGWVDVAKLKALLTDESEGDKKPHQLYLYSLYMHLADMAHYQHYEAAKIPPYFEKNTYKVTSKELDEVKGLNLRSKPESGAVNASNILAVLQTGTKVKLHLDFHEEGKNSWYAVASLCEGYHAIPSLNTIDYTLADGQTSKAILGWIFIKGTIDESGEYTIGVSEDKYDKSKGLRVRSEGKASGTIVSMLPEGTQIHTTSTIPAQGYVKISHNDIESGKATLPLAEGDYYIRPESLSLIAGKQRYDEVVVLDEPLPVKAGEVIGHIGHYQYYEQKVKKDSLPTPLYSPENGLKSFSFKHCLHVELFSCDDFTTFINNTRKESKKILNKDKQLLLVEKGAKLYRIKNGSEDATIASNVDVQVVGHYAERWQQVKECYRLSFNATDFGYELKNIGETLAITASNKTKFVTLLGTQTSETITEADIPNQVAFTGTYINPTTGTNTTDKATAIKANSGYSDISVTLVRQSKTIWVDVSELENGKRRSLSSTLTGWKAHPLSSAESDDNLVVGYPQIIKIHGLNNVEVFGIAERATDESGKAWRYITAGSDKHLEIKGWVKTTQEKVKRVSPWEWPGFVQIEESKTLTDLSRLNLAKEAQLAEYQVNQLQQAEPADYENCQLLKHLSTIIKHINHDEAEVPLNDKHLKAALGYPWIAQQLGHTVVKYESEWYSEKDDAGNMPKWEALDVPVIGEAKSYLDFLNEDCDKNTALSNIELSYCEKMPGADTKKLLQETEVFLETLSRLNEQSTVDATKAAKVEKFKDELAKQIAIWTAEKQRIAQLLWWGELAEKLAKKQADQVAQTASAEGATAEGEKAPMRPANHRPRYPRYRLMVKGGFCIRQRCSPLIPKSPLAWGKSLRMIKKVGLFIGGLYR